MKRLLFAPLFLILLTSCQSKRDICASWAADQINNKEAAKKLDIDIGRSDYEYEEKRILSAFCKYYRN